MIEKPTTNDNAISDDADKGSTTKLSSSNREEFAQLVRNAQSAIDSFIGIMTTVLATIEAFSAARATWRSVFSKTTRNESEGSTITSLELGSQREVSDE